MTTRKSTPIKGLVLRASREDACGVPLCGPTASVVSKGFIECVMTPNVDTGTDFSQKLADGTYCVGEKDCDTIKWWDVELTLCGVDPALYELAGGQTPVLDFAAVQQGFRGNDVACGVNFGFEMWTKLAQAQCVPGADGAWGYFLLPGLTNMQLEALDIGNKTVDFKMKGNTFINPNWCKGAYDVTWSAADTPSPLLTAIGPSDHFHYEAVPVAPPTPADGYTTVPCIGMALAGTPSVPVPCV